MTRHGPGGVRQEWGQVVADVQTRWGRGLLAIWQGLLVWFQTGLGGWFFDDLKKDNKQCHSQT